MRLDDLIAKSETFGELWLRMSLAGLVSSPEECLGILTERYFQPDVFTGGFRGRTVGDRIEGFFRSADPDLTDRCIASREVYMRLFRDSILDLRDTYMTRSRLADFSAIVEERRPGFLRGIRLPDGSNLLMAIALLGKFELRVRILQNAIPAEKPHLDAIFETHSASARLVRFLVGNAGCDPYLKNAGGRCFADYFSERCMEELSEKV